ncbi:MAG: aminopeptidase [Deltaproteobacteria bacterium]|nr:aminopeptidase [Deltaproteobacteria bacterium]
MMRVRNKKTFLLGGLMLLTAGLIGCESVGYYSQVIQGQYSLLQKRQPISEIIADPDSPEFLRDRLSFILGVRQFAKNDLQLPVKRHYLTYVDLKRPYVVWNVFAAPEFSLTPKTWCYPVVGCAAYRGYFSEEIARQYADGLVNQGYEVYVAGVTAYSTLGWFDDPVLSTFVQYSKVHAAALIFHELAHQVLYVKGDTVFNESFATAVEQEGLRRWQLASKNSQVYGNYLKSYRRQQQFVRLIMHYRNMLESLYQKDTSPTDKRGKKASIFSELRDEFEHLKTREADLSAYDEWMNQPLNNAKIGSVVAYHDLVPTFQKLLEESDNDLNRFYKVCHQLAQKPKDERQRILKTYLAGETN